MPEFIAILRDEFFSDPVNKQYVLDVGFNNDFTKIKASRFYVQSRSLKKTKDQEEMMRDVREEADDSKYDVEIFASEFIFYDSHEIILPNTIQNMGIAVACMMVVAFLLIPSMSTVIWVTLSVLSICLCIVGFMSLWDVSLDGVSMINLVMCIGFSIDFSAHISYHFGISQAEDPLEKAKEALGYLGTPIMQGAGLLL